MITLLLLFAIDPAMIERRYNSAATLRVTFEQSYRAGGRSQAEAGVLTLRKPGRMRWEYRQPAGKMFVSDGKQIWFYSPAANRVEVSRVREATDLRAPLAFLLGRLDFKRDFKEVTSDGDQLVAIPKNAQAPYREVRFRAELDGRIAELIVTGQDAAVMRFVFSDEERNASVNDSLFTFVPPAGVEVVTLRGDGQ